VLSRDLSWSVDLMGEQDATNEHKNKAGFIETIAGVRNQIGGGKGRIYTGRFERSKKIRIEYVAE
jgi:hypothetical protein